VDNLVESYFSLTKKEYAVVIIMVVIIGVSDQLIYAVLTGVVLAALIFAVQYGRINVVRSSFSGADYDFHIRRRYVEQRVLQHLGRRFLVIRLQHFIFFGTSSQVVEIIRDHLEESAERPSPQRLRYLILDFSRVYNIDWTGVSAFQDIMQMLSDAKVRVVVCGAQGKVREKLRQEKVFAAAISIQDFDSASEFVENKLMQRAMKLRMHWFSASGSFRKLQEEAMIREENEFFEILIGRFAKRILKYVSTKKVNENELICKAGKEDSNLYLLASGKAFGYFNQLEFKKDSKKKRIFTLHAGSFFNEQALFSIPVGTFDVEAQEECTLYCLSRKNLDHMEAADPRLATELLKVVLKQLSLRSEKGERSRSVLQSFDSKIRGRYSEENWRAGSHMRGITHVVKMIRDAPREAVYNAESRSKPMSIGTMIKKGSQLFLSPIGDSCNQYRQNLIAKGERKSRPKTAGCDDSVAVDLVLSNCHLRDAKRVFDKMKRKGFGESKEDAMKLARELGHYPNIGEMARIKEILQAIKGDSKAYMDVLYQILKVLTFAKLSPGEIQGLRETFKVHCGGNGNLSLGNLGNLMVEMGYHADNAELAELISEWGDAKTSSLNFQQFVSMCSAIAKREELVEDIEKDFLEFARSSDSKSKNASEGDLRITVEGIVRTMKVKGKAIPRFIAEEMLFDADFLDRGYLSIDELVAYLSIVYKSQQSSENMLPVAFKRGLESFRRLQPIISANSSPFIELKQ